MTFYQTLIAETAQNRDYLLNAPIIKRSFSQDVCLDDYVMFLKQAYHHVKHTVPLLMATGSHLPESKEWLRNAVAEYIEEELGHQEWILNDIAKCGFDKESARHSTPSHATELMVAYAYDSVTRINPLCFFGMVQVLEGTSIALADAAADNIKSKLALPSGAFTYLKSHGALDQDHIQFFESLMNQITDQQEQALIIKSANTFYKLYADIFYQMTPKHDLAPILKTA